MDILFATSNKNKVAEANQVSRKYGITFSHIHVLYPEIRSDSVAEVAKSGAQHVYDEIKRPLVVEDSGLFIKALNDFPGAYSHFVFDKIGNKGILKLMEGVEDREARFVSAVAYYEKNERKNMFMDVDYSKPVIFEGVVEGKITLEERGSKGFGYDPIFRPKGYVKTFAEDPKTKSEASHRRIAFEKLCEWLTSKPGEQRR